MQVDLKKEKFLDNSIILLYFLLFASLFFSWRAISSIMIGLLLIRGIIKQKGSFAVVAGRTTISYFIIACLFFFLLQFTPLLLPHQEMHWSNVRMKSAILLIPLAIVLTGKFNENKWQLLWQSYCLLLLVALMFCIAAAVILFLRNNDSAVFFYHSLVKPLHQHAVYFSIYVFIAFIILMEGIRSRNIHFKPVIQYLLILFFTFSLVLLSSKLVLSMLLASLVYYGFLFLKHTTSNKKLITGFITGLLLLISVVFITRNPVSQRFREILSGDLALASKEKFDPGIYFTGAQLRLLQWRFVPEIINAHQAWWTGVGSLNAQKLLDEKYISTHMYIGEPSRGDKGFLGLNTHNQLLASYLKNGIPGIIVFLFILSILIVIAWQQRKSGYLFIFLLLIIYSFVESVLETQYALFLFTFFPVFLLQED